jgi:DNA recombination protein RmuC
MQFNITFLAFIVVFALGAAAAWLLRSRDVTRLGTELTTERDRIARADAAQADALRKVDTLLADLQQDKVARAAAEATASRVVTLEADLKSLQERLAMVSQDKARIETERVKDREMHDAQIAVLSTLRGDIEKEMKALASEALKGNQSSFLALAEQVFEKHKQSAAGDLEQRQKAIETLLAPIATTLEEYKKGLTDIEKARLEAYTGLTTELQNIVRTQTDVSTQTRKLVNALRAAPKTRGRWGEQQLHNVLELSGMTPYIDFFPEESFQHEDTKLRPDVVLRMPGDRRIVIDAKTSMAAYLDAIDATEDEIRETHLHRHSQQLRQHMKLLAAKAYWQALPFTPDFVVMFIPGDNFFSAAAERDPHLFEDAIMSRVFIVTPTTLIALAKAIAFGWRQEKVAENARHVAELGRDLYKRLSVMGSHVLDLGRGLDRTVKSYNSFVGSMEGSVMPQARKFNELQVDGTQDLLPELKLVDTETRQLRADRDLVVQGAEIIALPTGTNGADPSTTPIPPVPTDASIAD